MKEEEKQTSELKVFSMEVEMPDDMQYPRPSWSESVMIYTNGVVIRDKAKCVRTSISETEHNGEQAYIWYRRFINKIPDLQEIHNPYVSLKRLRGNLWEEQRVFYKESMDRIAWAMNYFLENKYDFSMIWTHPGTKTEEK